ncbi:hypothetical protein JCM19238_5197 [Vibrio ponticus]|nr:hypothetical protein JCM19238_5197 [Vibrio ponticus]
MDGALSEPLPVETYLFKIIIDEFGDYYFAKDDVTSDNGVSLRINLSSDYRTYFFKNLQSVENAPHRAQLSDHYIQETIIPALKENGADYSAFEQFLESARSGSFEKISAFAMNPYTGVKSEYVRPSLTTMGGIYNFSIENHLVLANKQNEVKPYSNFGDVNLQSMGVYNGGTLYPVLYLEEPSDPYNKYTLVLKLAEESEGSYRKLGEKVFYSPSNSATIYEGYHLLDLENEIFVLDRIEPHVSAESDKVFDFAIVDEAGTIVTKCEPYRLELKISEYDDPNDSRYMNVDVKSPIFTFDGETCTLR